MWRRRWVLALGIIVLVLAVVVAVGWFLWLPNWRPGLEDGERYAIDVSHHQGVIDWPAVAADGIGFAYLKATEGEDWVDRRFAANWADAGRAGLDRGAYHFFSLCSPGAAQARHFLATAPPDRNALPPALDLEIGGNCASRPSRDQVTREVAAFVNLVESAWRQPVLLYVLDDWLEVYLAPEGRPTWHRSIITRPDGHWRIWQVHGFAHVDGVDGRVDLDVMRVADPGSPQAAGRSGRSPRRTG